MMNVLEIPYPENLLISLKRNKAHFEADARLLLAIKLFELDQITTGQAAELAGVSRVDFIFELKKHRLSPVGVDPDELDREGKKLGRP